MLVFRKKGRKITMYENMKILSCFDGYYTGDEPFGIRFVGETLCDDEFIIERPCSDLASFEYIVDGCGTLEINGQVLHPKKGDIFFERKQQPQILFAKGKRMAQIFYQLLRTGCQAADKILSARKHVSF